MTMLEHSESIEIILDVIAAHRGGVLSADRAMRLIGLVVPPALEQLAGDLVDDVAGPEPIGVGAVLAEPADKAYPCELCERSFASLGAVRIHATRKHSPTTAAASSPAPPPAAAVATFPQLGPIERRPVDHDAVRVAQADAS